MRRFAIFTAGAALVLGSLAIPGMAVANGRTASPEKSTTISAQSVSLDTQFVAQGKGHRHGHDGYRKEYRRGYRHGYSDSRHGYRHGHRGGSCYGCDGPGSRCDRYGCGYGGYRPGGFGCNFDYPCGPPFDEQCRSFRGAPSADPKCQAQPTEPAPGQSAQPTPDTGTQPAPAPAPEQGGTQPRPY